MRQKPTIYLKFTLLTLSLIGFNSGQSVQANDLAKEPSLISESNAQGDTALHLASANNMQLWVNWLLKSGASVNTRNQQNLTPFLLAAREGHCQILEALFQHNKNVISDLLPNGQNALHLAIKAQKTRAIPCLMKMGSSPIYADKSGLNPLILAVKLRQKKSLEEIENSGFRVKTWLLRPRQKDGQSWLQYFAGQAGQSESLKILLEYGFDPQKAPKGPSALQIALRNGLLDNAAVLLSNSGKIKSREQAQNVWRFVSPLLKGNSLSNSAQRDVLTDLLRDLLRYQNFLEHDQLVHERIREQDFKAVQFLLDFIDDIEHPASNGDSLLLSALRQEGPQRQAFVELLLKAGAKPTVLDKQGNTAMHLAVKSHRSALVRLLLKHIDELPPNQQGETALDWARDQEDDEILSLLRPLYIKNIMRNAH